MTYGKDFRVDTFYTALTNKFQKTSEIASKVGCCRKTATSALNLLMVIKQGEEECYGLPVDIEMKWVSGGRAGTRAWRRITIEEVAEIKRKTDNVREVYFRYRKTCKFKISLETSLGTCTSKENESRDCSYRVCPMIIGK